MGMGWNEEKQQTNKQINKRLPVASCLVWQKDTKTSAMQGV